MSQENIRLFKEIGIIKSEKSKQLIKCLLHNEISGYSLYLNFEKGFYKCLGKCCTSGSLQDLLIALGIETLLEENEYDISEAESESPTLEDYIISDIQEIYDSNTKIIPYLDKRGLDYNIYSKNLVYLKESDKRVYFPIFFDKTCFGHTSRTIFDENKIYRKIVEETGIEATKEEVIQNIFDKDERYKKYASTFWTYKYFMRYLSSPIPKNEILYEPLTNDDSREVYLLTEGIVDALKVNQFGYNSFALLGGSVEDNHIEILYRRCNNKTLIAALDNDEAGERFYERLIEKFGVIIPRLDYRIVKGVKDIGDIKEKVVLDELVNNYILY